jgi:hypothetical protein
MPDQKLYEYEPRVTVVCESAFCRGRKRRLAFTTQQAKEGFGWYACMTCGQYIQVPGHVVNHPWVNGKPVPADRPEETSSPEAHDADTAA